jgi:hypothetical protein
MEAPLFVLIIILLAECLKIFRFVIKILTFLMSFKSTLYASYSQNPVEFTQKNFFQSDDSHTHTHKHDDSSENLLSSSLRLT